MRLFYALFPRKRVKELEAELELLNKKLGAVVADKDKHIEACESLREDLAKVTTERDRHAETLKVLGADRLKVMNIRDKHFKSLKALRIKFKGVEAERDKHLEALKAVGNWIKAAHGVPYDYSPGSLSELVLRMMQGAKE